MCHWPISDLEEFDSKFLWITWSEEGWSEVIWLGTPPMTYFKALVSISIWHSGLKCLKIGASVKAFCRCIKAFLAPGVRKSVLEKLAFANSFLDLADFVMVDRFSKIPPTPLTSAPAVPLGTSWFFSFLVAWVLRALLLFVWSIEVSSAAILLKFWMNFL